MRAPTPGRIAWSVGRDVVARHARRDGRADFITLAEAAERQQFHCTSMVEAAARSDLAAVDFHLTCGRDFTLAIAEASLWRRASGPIQISRAA